MSKYLHSLEIVNFRQFENRRLTFKPGFNLLVGENGAGKTTILRGVLAALGNGPRLKKGEKIVDRDIGLYQDSLNIDAQVNSPVHLTSYFGYAKELSKSKATRYGSEERPLTIYYSSTEAVGSEIQSRTPVHDRGAPRLSSVLNTEEFLYRAEMEMTQVNREASNSDKRFGNSNSVRQFVRNVLKRFSAEISDFHWRFIPIDCSLVIPEEMKGDLVLSTNNREHLRNFALRWFQEESALNKDFIWPDDGYVFLSPFSDENSSLPNAYRLLRDFGERLELDPTLMKMLTQCSLAVRLRPRILVQRGELVMLLDQLSDGEKRLFTLFVDIARQLSLKYSNEVEHFGNGSAIVLIDEIDVHLHPKWQRLIVPALEELFPRCQFIATTHSPFVIQATDRDKIIAIDPSQYDISLDGGNSIEDIIEDIQGIPLPQRSWRAQELSRAAKRYFRLLELNALGEGTVNPVELIEAKKLYRKASEPFSSDSAVDALLEMIVVERARKK